MEKRLLSRIIFMLVVVLMLGTQLTGCGQKITESDVSYAGPILDNVLAGIKDKNYDEFSKDFSTQLKNVLTKEEFNSAETLFDSKIGDYEGKTFAGATNITKDNKTFTSVVYKGKYSKETSDVLITISFSDDNGKKVIEGLVLNSPKLQKQ